jgi:hypothetical protein
MEQIKYTKEDVPLDLAKKALEDEDLFDVRLLAIEFSKAVGQLRDIAFKRGLSFFWINQHPITMRYLNRMNHLNGDIGGAVDCVKWYLVERVVNPSDPKFKGD